MYFALGANKVFISKTYVVQLQVQKILFGSVLQAFCERRTLVHWRGLNNRYKMARWLITLLLLCLCVFSTTDAQPRKKKMKNNKKNMGVMGENL